VADEPGTHRGWLPPNAPGAEPPPRFDAVPQPPAPAPEPEPAPEPPAPAREWAPPGVDWQRPPATPQEVPAARAERPTFTRHAPPGERNTTAAWALGLGIAGMTLLLVSLGTLFLVTLPCSIAAWRLGQKAQDRLESGEISAGQGQATAALWLGRVGVIAGVAALVAFVALTAAGFDWEQFRDDLQRELDEQQRRQDSGGSGVRSAIEGLRAVIGR
jgi:hypothetical protein